MSLAKLTSLSTQTLSLLLERQRLQSLPTSSPQPPSSKSKANAKKIHDNLQSLRTGILELESKLGGGPNGPSASEKEAVRLLKSQFERMRGMFSALESEGDLGVIEGFVAEEPPKKSEPEAQQTEEEGGETGIESKGGIEDLMANGSATRVVNGGISTFKPYKDDPHDEGDHDGEDGDGGHETVLERQRLLMEEQDTHLTQLSNSISRQHHLSIQINTELDSQTGLLEELDTELDNTGSRLSGARRALGRFERGVKGNVSTLSIAILIVVLLILIIVFKT